jgi:poly-gamma-glutamate capsule biosynthesis protein CapA/YwtB (metallophosphatase superfamily)
MGGAIGATALGRLAWAAAPELNLTVMGQALIQHDLRQHPWPDYAVLAAMFGKADLCFTDLETAIRSPRAETPTRQDVFLHAADPAVLDCLKDWHIGLLATANNHAFDLGTGGILGALDELDRRDLGHAGTGVDLAAASAPAYRRTANDTVALVAAASGAIREGGAATASRGGVNELRVNADIPNAEDGARVLAAIRDAAAQADIVIAYHHNHVLTEKGRRVPSWQQEFAHRCIDAGAAIFVSHGAPWLLGIEIYHGRPIFYDLGSLVFQTATEAGTYDASAWQSVIAECRFGGGGFAEMRLTPVRLNAERVDGDPTTRGRPSLAHGAEAGAISTAWANSRPRSGQRSRARETAGSSARCSSGRAAQRPASRLRSCRAINENASVTSRITTPRNTAASALISGVTPMRTLE